MEKQGHGTSRGARKALGKGEGKCPERSLGSPETWCHPQANSSPLSLLPPPQLRGQATGELRAPVHRKRLPRSSCGAWSPAPAVCEGRSVRNSRRFAASSRVSQGTLGEGDASELGVQVGAKAATQPPAQPAPGQNCSGALPPGSEAAPASAWAQTRCSRTPRNKPCQRPHEEPSALREQSPAALAWPASPRQRNWLRRRRLSSGSSQGHSSRRP